MASLSTSDFSKCTVCLSTRQMLQYFYSAEINPVQSGTALVDSLRDEILQRQEVLAGHLIAELRESSDLSWSGFLSEMKKEQTLTVSFSHSVAAKNVVFC